MRAELTQLLDLAVSDPDSSTAVVAKLSNPDRRLLLTQAASGDVSRRLSLANIRLGSRADILGLNGGVAHFFAQSSLPALPPMTLHFFRDATRKLWGRAEISATTFLGPSYFGVSEKSGLTLRFDRVPPAEVIPEGWPPVRPNAALSEMLFHGVTLRLFGHPGGIITGTVWRGGKNQGVFLNLVREA